MEIRIEPSSGENDFKLKQFIIELCKDNEFGTWRYKDFSFGEEALYKELFIDGRQTTIAFILDAGIDYLLFVPAKMKGDGIIPLEELSSCICDFISILIKKCPLTISSILILL